MKQNKEIFMDTKNFEKGINEEKAVDYKVKIMD